MSNIIIAIICLLVFESFIVNLRLFLKNRRDDRENERLIQMIKSRSDTINTNDIRLDNAFAKIRELGDRVETLSGMLAELVDIDVDSLQSLSSAIKDNKSEMIRLTLDLSKRIDEAYDHIDVANCRNAERSAIAASINPSSRPHHQWITRYYPAGVSSSTESDDLKSFLDEMSKTISMISSLTSSLENRGNI
jgi:hypothetical protein